MRETWVVCDECGHKQLEESIKLPPMGYKWVSICSAAFDLCHDCITKVRKVLPHVKVLQEALDQIDGPEVSPTTKLISRGKR